MERNQLRIQIYNNHPEGTGAGFGGVEAAGASPVTAAAAATGLGPAAPGWSANGIGPNPGGSGKSPRGNGRPAL